MISSDQITVLHLVGGKSFHGGTAAVVRDLVAAKVDGVQNWIWVSRDCPNEPELPLIRRGIASTVSASFFGDFVGALIDLPRLLGTIKQSNISILHAHSRLGIFLGWLAHQVFGTRFVIHLHFLASHRSLYWFLARTSGAEVIYNSNRTRDHFREHAKNGHVIFPSLQWPVQAAPNSSASRIVAAGAFVPNKKLDVAIEACGRLQSTSDAIDIIVYGLLPEAIAPVTQRVLVRKYKNLSFVTFAPWTVRWSETLRANDILVHASDSESFGLTILEAFSRGLKLVIAKPSFLETLAPEFSGRGIYYVVDKSVDSVADAIRMALADPLDAEILWRLRLPASKEFSTNSAAEKVRAIYQPLVARSKSRSHLGFR